MLGCAALQRSLPWKGEPVGAALPMAASPAGRSFVLPLVWKAWSHGPHAVAVTSSLLPVHRGTAGPVQPGAAQPGAKDLSAAGLDYIRTVFKEVKPENSL